MVAGIAFKHRPSDTNDKQKLCLGLDIVSTIQLSFPLNTDKVSFLREKGYKICHKPGVRVHAVQNKVMDETKITELSLRLNFNHIEKG